jgi:hypothetical protein
MNPSPKVMEESNKVFIPRRHRPDLRVNMERADGERVQFSAVFYRGKLVGPTFCLAPKQFGRKLGEIFDLWMKA